MSRIKDFSQVSQQNKLRSLLDEEIEVVSGGDGDVIVIGDGTDKPPPPR